MKWPGNALWRLLKNIQRLAPHITVCSIPGITSYQAAAARLNLPLVEGEQIITDANVFREKAPDYWTLIISKKDSGRVTPKKSQ